MQNAIVSIRDLSKTYGRNQAVAGLNLDILQGEFFGLLGPNGAGKTTTIGMLTGLIEPSAGTITIGGLQMRSDPLEIKTKLGFVPQDFAFYPSLNAKDNLFFFGSIYGLHGRRLRQRTEHVLELVQLHEDARRAVSTFSNGMKRRLNIAIGLLHEPDVLILDEPTVGVDAHMRQAIIENLAKLNDDGLTVLYTTHHMEEAQRLCHRVAIMEKGGIIAMDSPSALMAQWGEGLVMAAFDEPIPRTFKERLGGLGSPTLWDSNVVQIRLTTAKAEDVIGRVAALAEKAQIPIRSVEVLETSLETVYLRLTGQADADA